MSDLYFTSLLVVGGVCVGFALHATGLALQTRQLRYVYLLLLSLLEAAYCFVAWRYFTLTDSVRALPWAQAFCAFMPYITYLFGELTMDLAERRPPWLRRVQRVNLVLTTAFATGALVDMFAKTSLMIRGEVRTDLSSLHRHVVAFTPLGQGYLMWVSAAFACFAVVLIRGHRARHDLFPMVLGSIIYFITAISDFGVSQGLFDAPFVQHFGFFALVLGCWRVLANRFETALGEMERAVKRLEEQRNRLLIAAPMLHKQKLDSLGTLAAGVAHEINNPIQGIMNYARLLKRDAPPDTDVSRFADEIAEESKRVAEIVQNLLRFGRAEGTVAIAVDISEILDGTLTLIRSSLAQHNITLKVHVAEGLPELTCRAAQLRQVIMNLVTNARDAIISRDATRTDEKQITIEASHLTGDGEVWWALEVSDTGDGFDPSLSECIFDPFFTTKGEAGTGLGLSVSHGIVDAHGGRITCASERGKGARFCVKIPCRPLKAEPDAGATVSISEALGDRADA